MRQGGKTTPVRDGGTVPVRELPSTLMLPIDWRAAQEVGILPVNPLLCKFRSWRLDSELQEEGKVPKTLLNPRNRY